MPEQVGRYLSLLKRWWWLLIIGAIVPAVLANFLLSQEPDVYQATATLVVGNTLQNPEPNQWELNVANTLANAYARIVSEEPVTQAVIDRLNLGRSPGQLAGQITTNVYADAQLLEIAVVDIDPRAAALIANSLAEELVRRSPISQEDQAERQAFISGQLDDLEAQIELVNADIADLQSTLLTLTSAAELQEAQDRLGQLESLRSNLQETYASLLESYQTEIPNIISVFDPAIQPAFPLPRRDKLVTLAAGLAGLFVAAGGALLIEYLDDTVKGGERAQANLLGTPVLGGLAKMNQRNGAVVLGFDLLSPAAEMARNLRTSIFLAARENPLDTLCFTSAQLGEGKTFAVAQLGITLAKAGERVALVDADLRRPTLHEKFDLPNLTGLSDLLAGHMDFSEKSWLSRLVETEVENLYLLPAGRPPEDPTFFLSSHRFEELLEALVGEVDIVMLDSPPASAGPDIDILGSIVDGVVIIVAVGQTSRRKVQRVIDRLQGKEGVNLLGLALNRVKLDGYGYYYRYDKERRRGLARLWARLPFVGRRGAPEEGKRVLSLAEAADHLGVSRATARRWCEEGRLTATKKLLWWRVDAQELERAIEEMLS
jgi:non-specific protein-tyrosine kinase